MDFLEKILPREYQKKILETCLKKNCLVVIPTGLGKTLIALMLAIERMKEYPGEKILFLAPTKPLAEQHLTYFKKHLPELFCETTLFTGNINSEKRKKIWERADIIFSTPQCIANDLKKSKYSLQDVCLLVEDEAHRCVKNYDYNYVAQKYMQQSNHPKILGLTASPGSESSKIKEICKNLSIQEVEIRTRDSQDVKKYLQKLNFEKIFVELPEEIFEIQKNLANLFNKQIKELKNRKILWGKGTKTELISLQKKIISNILKGNKDYNNLIASSVCAQAIKIHHAIELIETQTIEGFNKYLKELFKKAEKKENKGAIKLSTKPEMIYSLAKSEELLANGLEHPKISKIEEIVNNELKKNKECKIIIFTQFRDTARIISKKINKINGIKSEIFVGQTKKIDEKTKKGYTGLNQKQQKKIIDDFSKGKTNILCATTIGEEGLDIPEVNTVIFYEPVPSAIRKIQRAGRTARLIEGNLLILITKNTKDETYFYVSKIKEKKMHDILKNLKKDFSKTKEIQKKL